MVPVRHLEQWGLSSMPRPFMLAQDNETREFRTSSQGPFHCATELISPFLTPMRYLLLSSALPTTPAISPATMPPLSQVWPFMDCECTRKSLDARFGCAKKHERRHNRRDVMVVFLRSCAKETS